MLVTDLKMLNHVIHPFKKMIYIYFLLINSWNKAEVISNNYPC